eukprot:3990756-Pyramimonas_sp.AAC.1
MIKKTKDKVDMLNPTGNIPWQPSQKTVIKGWQFGTGRAEPEVLDMLQKKYMQLPHPMLLNRDHLQDYKDKGPIKDQ